MGLVNVLAVAVSGLASALLGYVALRLSRQAQRYGAQRAIGDLQTAVTRFRAEYPNIMAFAPTWTAAYYDELYGHRQTEHTESVIRYYSYVDLGLEFCNSALSARSEGVISTQVFEGHYRPLVRMFLTENYPFVKTTLPNPFLSTFIRDELRAAEATGWVWQQQHERLVTPSE